MKKNDCFLMIVTAMVGALVLTNCGNSLAKDYGNDWKASRIVLVERLENGDNIAGTL